MTRVFESVGNAEEQIRERHLLANSVVEKRNAERERAAGFFQQLVEPCLARGDRVCDEVRELVATLPHPIAHLQQNRNRFRMNECVTHDRGTINAVADEPGNFFIG